MFLLSSRERVRVLRPGGRPFPVSTHSYPIPHCSASPSNSKLGMSRHPEVLWAQRSNMVYLTIALPDAKDVSVKCEPQGLFYFSGIGVQDEKYECKLELYASIVPEGCKTTIGLRNILCSVQKEHNGWWKRLLKSEEKPAAYLKVDWNKWCDEDDEELSSDLGSDDNDAVFNGEVSNDDSDDDDEGMLYLPDLEKAAGN